MPKRLPDDDVASLADVVHSTKAKKSPEKVKKPAHDDAEAAPVKSKGNAKAAAKAVAKDEDDDDDAEEAVPAKSKGNAKANAKAAAKADDDDDAEAVPAKSKGKAKAAAKDDEVDAEGVSSPVETKMAKEYINMADLSFTTKTVSFSTPQTRPEYESKDPTKVVDASKPKGKVIYTTFKHKRPDKSVYEGPLRMKCILPKYSFIISDVSPSEGNAKVRISVLLRKEIPEELEVLTKLGEYINLFVEHCVNSNGAAVGSPLYAEKKVKAGDADKKGKLTPEEIYERRKTAFGVMFSSPVIGFNNEYLDPDEWDDKCFLRMTINYWSTQNKYNAGFMNLKKEEIHGIDNTNILNYIAGGAKIKFTFSLKEHWVVSSRNGITFTADTIMIAEQPLRDVMMYNTPIKGLKKKFTMNMVYRSAGTEKEPQGAYSIGGNIGIMTDDGRTAPLLFQFPPIMNRFAVKNQFENKNGKASDPTFQHYVPLGDQSTDCINAQVVRKLLESLETVYTEKFLEELPEIIESVTKPSDPDWQIDIDENFIKTKQTFMVKYSKDKKTGTIAKDRPFMNLKYLKKGNEFAPRVYILDKALAEKAIEEPESAADINTLASDFYNKQLFISSLSAKSEIPHTFLTPENIETVIPTGTWYIPIVGVEKYFSYHPSGLKTANDMSVFCGHGLCSKLEAVIIIKYDSASISRISFGAGFEDADIEEEDTTKAKPNQVLGGFRLSSKIIGNMLASGSTVSTPAAASTSAQEPVNPEDQPLIVKRKKSHRTRNEDD